MMKTRLLTIAFATTALLGAVQLASAQNIIVDAKQEVSGFMASKQLTDVSKSIYGLFDSLNWHDGAGHVKPGEMIEFDPLNPKSWAKIINPKTHSRVHMTITNPQFYGKFMTPEYYVRFMQPKTWLSYLDPATYQPLLNTLSDPKTATYWIQPGAYIHGLNPNAYLQMLDPNAYTKLASSVADGYRIEDTKTAANMFNPFSWMKQFADAATSTVKPEVKQIQ